MLDWLLVVGLGFACLIGTVLTVVRLPGTWLLVLTAAAAGYFTEWAAVSVPVLIALVVIAVVAEILEAIFSVLTVRKAGATRRAAWGSLIGGFAGMIVFTPLIPIPVVGTVVGALLGCFAGALIGEYTTKNELGQSTRVGLFAAAGFVLGTMAKVFLAIAMSGLLVGSAVHSAWSGAGSATP